MRRLFSQLSFRLAAASGVLALLIGATFALLLVAIDDVRMENRLADRSRTSLTASDGVAELVLDDLRRYEKYAPQMDLFGLAAYLDASVKVKGTEDLSRSLASRSISAGWARRP